MKRMIAHFFFLLILANIFMFMYNLGKGNLSLAAVNAVSGILMLSMLR